MSDPTNDDLDGPVSPDAESAARDQMERRAGDTEVNIFDGVRAEGGGPVLPVRLKPADMFAFSCHRGISCWNKCCYGADVTLTPRDILVLSRRLAMRPAEFLVKHTTPGVWERADLPVAKLNMSGDKGACTFLHTEDGCTVYEDRPATCRYYPLGLGVFKTREADDKTTFHFLVKETHCKGHDESKLQSVTQFRAEQGVEAYDRVNQGWMDVLMKMASWKTLGGPGGKEVSEQTKQMFYMVSTDVDAFRRFVFQTKFLDTYYVDEVVIEALQVDDEALLGLGFDWMKNLLFNEPTITMREEVLQHAIATTRGEMGGV